MFGHPILEFVHPEDCASTALEFGRTMDGVHCHDFENCYRCADGSYRWLRWSCPPVQAEAGKLYATVQDCTEPKQSEQRLADGARRQDETAALAQLGGWEYDVETKWLRWSDEGCRIHALPAGHCPNLEEAISYYTPEAQIAITALVRTTIATGESWDVEPEMLDGKCQRLLGAFQDTTERRRGEEQLRRSEARNRALLAAMPDYVVQVSSDGTIFDFHDGDRGSLDFPLRNAIGEKLKDRVSVELWTEFEAAFERLGEKTRSK